jgi:C4-type Zn-finger protein
VGSRSPDGWDLEDVVRKVVQDLESEKPVAASSDISAILAALTEAKEMLKGAKEVVNSLKATTEAKEAFTEAKEMLKGAKEVVDSLKLLSDPTSGSAVIDDRTFSLSLFLSLSESLSLSP